MINIVLSVCLILFGVLPAFAAERQWEAQSPPAPALKAAQHPQPAVSREDPPTVLDVEKVKKILEVLKESPTPLRTPDTMLKVLFLPYTDAKGVLHNYKDTFLRVEEGKWILGDYLKAPGGKNKRMVLRPLESPLPPRTADGQEKQDGVREHREQPDVSQPAAMQRKAH